MRCNKCGSEIPNGASFCSKCGTFLVCHVCKKPIVAGAGFCGECGASMHTRTVPGQNGTPQTPFMQNGRPQTPFMQNGKPQNPAVQNNRPQNPAAQNVRPQTPPVQNVRPQAQPPKKKKGSGCIWGMVIMLVLFVIILIAAIVSFVYFSGKMDGRDKPVEPTYATDIVIEYPTSVVTPIPTVPPVSTQNNDYLFPSDTEYITESDLNGLSKEEVAYIRNEIYARHGYIFKNKEYQRYFESKSWYSENQYFSESDFNSIERANKDFLVKYETERGWR